MTSGLTFEQLVIIAAGIGTLISVGTAIWTIFSAGSRANSKKIDSLDGRVTNVERLQQRQTDQIAGMPDKEQMHRLEVQMTHMSGQMEVFNEHLVPVKAIAERLQELLISRSDKGKGD